MPGRFTTLVAILAGYALLIVVVCPATPTPIAVSKGKQADLAVAVAPLLTALAPAHTASLKPRSEASPLAAPNVLALTCTRLC